MGWGQKCGWRWVGFWKMWLGRQETLRSTLFPWGGHKVNKWFGFRQRFSSAPPPDGWKQKDHQNSISLSQKQFFFLLCVLFFLLFCFLFLFCAALVPLCVCAVSSVRRAEVHGDVRGHGDDACAILPVWPPGHQQRQRERRLGVVSRRVPSMLSVFSVIGCAIVCFLVFYVIVCCQSIFCQTFHLQKSEGLFLVQTHLSSKRRGASGAELFLHPPDSIQPVVLLPHMHTRVRKNACTHKICVFCLL